LWERDVAGAESPWIAGDWLFVVSAEQRIAAVSRQDGRVAWVTDLPRWQDEDKQRDPIIWYGPAVAGNRLRVVSSTGEMLSIGPVTGKITGRQSLPGPAALGPVVAQQTVFVLTESGTLLTFR
jgi:hypothetical protein